MHDRTSGGYRLFRGDPSAEGSAGRVGDHWEAKDGMGSKRHLRDIARRLDISGRSTMNKSELVAAIERANRQKTAAARR